MRHLWLLLLTALPAFGQAFDTVSIRPNPAPKGWQCQFTVDGLLAQGVTVRDLVQLAVSPGIDLGRITSNSDFADTARFNMEAKMDPEHEATFRQMSYAARQQMLLRLLEERFHLKTHTKGTLLPAYELRTVQGHPPLQHTPADDPVLQYQMKDTHGLVETMRPGALTVRGFTMDDFASLLNMWVDHPVLNRTQLSGYYNFTLHWKPAAGQQKATPAAKDTPSDPAGRSTLFTDIQEQLGLQLVPTKSMLPVLVIDHAESPAEN